MKKLLLTLSAISLLLCTPAQALPGDSYAKLSSWVKNHKFLSSNFIFKSQYLTGGFDMTAFRQLQDNYFIDVIISLDRNKLSFSETLSLEKKKFLTEDEFAELDEYRRIQDPRRWDMIESKHVWTRNDQTAFMLLESIYGKGLAEDFKSSKLVYNGLEYYVQASDSINRYKLDLSWNHPIEILGKVTIYKGTKWIYEVTDRSYLELSNETKIHPDLLLKQLTIKRVSDGLNEISILAHNQKVYEKYQAEKAAKELKNRPADIKIPQ